MKNYLTNDTKHYLTLSNGKEIEVTVRYLSEDDDSYHSYFEEELAADIIKKIERGELSYLFLTVEASYKGVTGSDSLGGCTVGSTSEAMDIIKEYHMVGNALDDLKGNLEDLMKGLTA